MVGLLLSLLLKLQCLRPTQGRPLLRVVGGGPCQCELHGSCFFWTLEGVSGVVVAVPVDLHFGFSVGEKVTEPLRKCNREALVNCSEKQVFPPDTVKFLGVVKEG